MKYSYLADGTKFKAVDATGNGFAYTGSLRWSVQNGVLTPESVTITGGRALYNDDEESWSANYFICDHLGSVRVVTDAEGEVLDTFDYMPYGRELMVNTDNNTTDYRFTGKEKQTAFSDSNIYDSFARFQNTYGRFMSIDPKAESFYHISPYAYCAGDPVNLVDPDGEIIKDPDGMVDKFVKKIKDRISLVESANIADNLKDPLLNAFEQTIRELRRLKRSKDIFTIVFDSSISTFNARIEYYSKDIF